MASLDQHHAWVYCPMVTLQSLKITSQRPSMYIPKHNKQVATTPTPLVFLSIASLYVLSNLSISLLLLTFPSFFRTFLLSVPLNGRSIKMDKLLLFCLSTTHIVFIEQQDNCLASKTCRRPSVVYSSLVSSSANSAMMSCTQMSLSSCEVSTRKTVNFLSQGLVASCTASSWATSGFFSTWFLKTMEASSDHCLGFTPAGRQVRRLSSI